MGDVIDLYDGARTDEIIDAFACGNCGNDTFNLYADGMVLCSECNALAIALTVLSAPDERH